MTSIPLSPVQQPAQATTVLPGGGPGIVLGMTLYNGARYLREATDSILSQTRRDFVLLMLDDASADDTELMAREYERADGRVRYYRHAERRGMVPTWHEVAEIAARDYPGAQYFAWVSDHDRWHAEWLARMAATLDAEPAVVLAYPVTLRMDDQGQVVEKEPRSFQTAGLTDVRRRWSEFCRHGVGSGDMVYGLIRMRALVAAGIFRSVLNPDRLLIAELTLQGQIRQLQTPLWWRRRSAVASIARQRVTLFAGPTPPWFRWPPTIQHAIVLIREYLRAPHPPARIQGPQLLWMLTLYQLTSVWRLFRKTDTSKSLGRGVDNAHWVKKLVKKGVLLTVHHTLVAFHKSWGKLRRFGRRALYELLMVSHRLGLRGSNGPGTQ